MKLKVNRVKHQAEGDDVATCGYHSMRFLIERLNGKSFPQATGYDDRIVDKSGKYERE